MSVSVEKKTEQRNIFYLNWQIKALAIYNILGKNSEDAYNRLAIIWSKYQ